MVARSIVSPAVLAALIAGSSWLLGGCEDDAAPESIPFEGLDPGARADRPKPRPQSTTTASASARHVAPRSSYRGSSDAARLQSCCSALRAAARSGDEGKSAQNVQAATVCASKVSAVRKGKMKLRTALSQVRSTLLGGAPSACR